MPLAASRPVKTFYKGFPVSAVFGLAHAMQGYITSWPNAIWLDLFAALRQSVEVEDGFISGGSFI